MDFLVQHLPIQRNFLEHLALTMEFGFFTFSIYVGMRQIRRRKICTITIAYQESSLGHQQNLRLDTSTEEPANSRSYIQLYLHQITKVVSQSIKYQEE